MIIYNVTIKVDWSIHEDWLQWMKQEHIPDMLSSKHFHTYQMVRLLQVDETDGPTYAVQYYAHSLQDYNRYLADLSKAQRQKGLDQWENKFVAYPTIMQVVN